MENEELGLLSLGLLMTGGWSVDPTTGQKPQAQNTGQKGVEKKDIDTKPELLPRNSSVPMIPFQAWRPEGSEG